MSLNQIDPRLGTEYEAEFIGYDIIPVFALRLKNVITAREVQLIALLGVLGFVATWIM